ncbi:copper amine oxidase N-terminal domain-containing protein [Paenibacillus sp. JSM ZJ436]|uniref:copper amine oxidase N-terminal domain-containing protein n=1 Tax=Paenibacillus sp. JSM ZJ436 TaxID=3376190 RepID=UPI0037B7A011
MKKLWTAFLAVVCILPLLFQGQVQAATHINVIVDGMRINPSQPPIMVQNRVMLPMRVIFQLLGAKVTWDQKTQTVTAVRDNSTIILKINAKTATIDGKSTTLDVPAKNLSGTTMVPVRFVSEALGEKIGWNSTTKTVTVTTSNNSAGEGSLGPVNYITLRDIGNIGDGRDLQVSFSKSANEQHASYYRVFLVKASKASYFNESAAANAPSANYSVIFPTGSDPSLTFSSNTRDSDGELIRENQAYTAFVLAVGKYSGSSQMSKASPAVTLINNRAVDAPTGVTVSDVNNYGDGRDLSVSFVRAASESQISGYRLFVVKTQGLSSFNLTAAQAVPATSYTSVAKPSSSTSQMTLSLGSSSRDTSGELIRSGVSYSVVVMALSSNESTALSRLSTPSSSVTLNQSASVPMITQVSDVSDYGDGRDLRVAFNKVSDESNIGSYRIYVVKSGTAGLFDVNRANNLTSYYYTTVNKNGYNLVHTLPATARDTDGQLIRSGVYYRVFVSAVGTGSQNGVQLLSTASNEIILSTGNQVEAVTGVAATDSSDYNDGRDLRITFNRANNESNILNYRVFVVKYNKSSSFSVDSANALSIYNYTQVNKTGYNLSQSLSSSTRDTDGDLLRNGNSYAIFVMSVSSNAYTGNVLSASSPYVYMSANQVVAAVTGLAVSDVSDNNDGRDLRVAFNRVSNESTIGHYKIYVVKNENAASFDLNWANSLDSSRYTYVSKTNNNQIVNLAAGARDINGDVIRNGVAYRIFVLTAGSGSYAGYSALSSPSSVITLSGNTSVPAASNVAATDGGNNNDGRDLFVSFSPAAEESRISGYRIYVVPSQKADAFNLAAANNVNTANYTPVNKTGSTLSVSLSATSTDTDGLPIRNMTAYRVFVVSVSTDGVAGNNALSAPSSVITMESGAVTAPTSVTASVYWDNAAAQRIDLSFTPATSGNVSEYRVMLVPTSLPFGIDDAKRVAANNYTVIPHQEGTITRELGINTRDVEGNSFNASSQSYHVIILAVGNPAQTNTVAITENVPLQNWPHPS